MTQECLEYARHLGTIRHYIGYGLGMVVGLVIGALIWR